LKRITILFLFITAIAGCKFDPSGYPLHDGLVDANATPETRALYANLKSMSDGGEKILIGNQSTTVHGVGWIDDPTIGERSDMKMVCGDFPAVYGWDAEGITGETGIEGIRFSRMQELIQLAYSRGGINTFSWHLHNIPDGGTAWDIKADINRILPGGDRNEAYTGELDALADYFLSLTGANGELIPVIFRPFHENNGTWFWWGALSCTPDEFKALWRFTVSYLRDVRHVHNLLYAYSPDRFCGYDGYLKRYPGNEWVDIMGHDNYGDFKNGTSPLGLLRLNQLVEMATAFGKVPALTETGSKNTSKADWYSLFLDPIKKCMKSRKVAYVMFWNNYDEINHYGPYPGEVTADDFVRFYNEPLTIFENDLPDMYR
jgi:mannan endo-1,4-beta-mannosidase